MKPAPASFAACIPLRGARHALDVAWKLGGALVIWQEIAGGVHLRLCRRIDCPPADSIAIEISPEWAFDRVVREIKNARRNPGRSRRRSGAGRTQRDGPPLG